MDDKKQDLPAVPDAKEEERVLPAFYCLKCRNTFREIGGKQYRDGDVAQWCPHCGASDDHIYELSAQEQAGMFIPPVLEKKETGGRNALNLQVEISSFLTAIINSERDFLLPCGSRLQHATANLLDALQSAQAASDGKERKKDSEGKEAERGDNRSGTDPV